jgi:hypothetical protein
MSDTPARKPRRRPQPSWAIVSAAGSRIVGGTSPDWWDRSRPATPPAAPAPASTMPALLPATPEPATPHTEPVASAGADEPEPTP